MPRRSPRQPRVSCRVATVLTGLALAGVTDVASSQAVVAPGNLGVGGSVVSLRDGQLVLLRNELGEGVDLNGDGDTLDEVAHVEFLPSGQSVTFAPDLDGPEWIQDAGTSLTILRRESKEGVDLNGDGDTLDFVPELHDLRAGTSRLLDPVASGIVGVNGTVRFVADDLLVVRSSEAAIGVDLNGDGDVADGVPHVLDLRAGTDTSLGLGGDLLFLDPTGRYLVGRVFERDEQKDLDGDGVVGPVNHGVVHVLDLRTGALTNVGIFGVLPPGPDGRRAFAQGRMIFQTRESDLGTDLDGDGALDANVFTVLDPATGTYLPTTLTSPAGLFTTFSMVRAVGDAFLVSVTTNISPYLQQRVYRVDPITGAVSPLGVTTGGSFLEQLQPSYRDVVALVVEEFGVDMSGDGDGDDRVLHLHDVPSGNALVTGLACELAYGTGELLVCTVREADTGVDGNGDGDLLDRHALVADFATGRVHAPPLAIDSIPVTDGRFVAFMVDESYQAGTDLNGDGDADDTVLHVLDPRDGSVRVLGAAEPGGMLLGQQLVSLDGGWIAFLVDEAAAGGVDLNGDGDTDDEIVHAFEL